jgi:hypothetical protein
MKPLLYNLIKDHPPIGGITTDAGWMELAIFSVVAYYENEWCIKNIFTKWFEPTTFWV